MIPEWCSLIDDVCWSLEAGIITDNCSNCEYSSYNIPEAEPDYIGTQKDPSLRINYNKKEIGG